MSYLSFLNGLQTDSFWHTVLGGCAKSTVTQNKIYKRWLSLLVCRRFVAMASEWNLFYIDFSLPSTGSLVLFLRQELVIQRRLSN